MVLSFCSGQFGLVFSEGKCNEASEKNISFGLIDECFCLLMQSKRMCNICDLCLFSIDALSNTLDVFSSVLEKKKQTSLGLFITMPDLY